MPKSLESGLPVHFFSSGTKKYASIFIGGLALLAVLALISPTSLVAKDDASGATVLDAIVVTASSQAETKREVSSNVTIISEKEIKRSGAQDLGDLMKTQGVQIREYPGALTNVGIRGQRTETHGNDLEGGVLVLLNGRRVGTGNASKIGLENVDRVEVIRGPSAIQYGSAGMGGVINIITKRGQEGFTAKVGAGIGSYGKVEESLSLNGGSGGFGVSMGVNHSTVDDYTTAGGDKWLHTGYDSKVKMNLDMGYTFLENHRLGVNFNYFKVDGQETPADGWRVTRLHPEYYRSMDKSNYNTALTYEGGTDDQVFTWLADYSFGKDEDQTETFDPKDASGWGNPPYSKSKSTVDHRSFLLKGSYDQGPFALTAGFDYLKYKIKESDRSFNPAKSSYENMAGFLLGKVRLFENKVVLSAGGRYDSFDVKIDDDVRNGAGGSAKDHNFSPTVGVAYSPLDWLKFRANFSEGFKMPTPKQLATNYSTAGLYGATYVGNPNLKPEKSKTFEIGADISWEYINAEFTYFHSKFKNKIIDTKDKLNRNTWENIKNSAIIEGIELKLSVDLGMAFGQDFELKPYVNYTHLTKRKNKDPKVIKEYKSDIIPFTPNTTASYGITFDHPGIDLMVDLKASYFGKELAKDWFDFMNPQIITNGGFTVTDLSLEKKLWDFEDKGHLNLRTEVNNIFNKKYEFVNDYPMPGRSFYVGISYNY